MFKIKNKNFRRDPLPANEPTWPSQHLSIDQNNRNNTATGKSDTYCIATRDFSSFMSVRRSQKPTTYSQWKP
jgi:hypothetical protein